MKNPYEPDEQLLKICEKACKKVLAVLVIFALAGVAISTIQPLDGAIINTLVIMGISMTMVLMTPDLIPIIKLTGDIPKQIEQLLEAFFSTTKKIWLAVGIAAPIGCVILQNHSITSPAFTIFYLAFTLVIFVLTLPFNSLVFAERIVYHAGILGRHSSLAYSLAESVTELAPKVDCITAYKLLLKAKCSIKLGQFGQAADFCTRAIELDPTWYFFYMTRGTAHYYLRNFDLAEEDYTKAIELKPNYSSVFLSRALARRDKHQHSALFLALEDIDMATKCSQHPGLLRMMIRQYGQTGTEPAHDSYYTHALRADIYKRMNRLDECEKELQLSLRANPNYHYARCLKVQLLLAQNKVDEAKAQADSLKKGHRYRDWNTAIWWLSTQSRVCLAINDYQTALDTANESLAISKERGWSEWNFCWIDRGNALIELNRGREALSDAEKAIELNPMHSSSYRLRANILLRTGRYEEAIQDINKAARLNPYDKYHDLRSTYLLAIGKTEEALIEADRGRAAVPPSSYAHANYALALLGMDRVGEAMESAEEATKINEYCVEAWVARGRVAAAAGDTAVGEEYLNKAIEMNPYQAKAYEIRAGILNKLGKHEKAEADRKKSEVLRDEFMS